MFPEFGHLVSEKLQMKDSHKEEMDGENCITYIPIESNKDRKQQKHPLGLQQSDKLLEFLEHLLVLGWVTNFCSIRADYFLWGRKKEREWKTSALNTDQDKVSRISNLASFILSVIQGKLNGRADQLAELAKSEPNTSYDL